MNQFKLLNVFVNYRKSTQRFSSKIAKSIASQEDELSESFSKRIETFKKFFDKHDDLKGMFGQVPHTLMRYQRDSTLKSLHLISPKIAEKIVSHIIPAIKSNKDHLICETCASLGLITDKLLKENVRCVQIHETMVEFQRHLKTKWKPDLYQNRIRMFSKDFLNLSKYDFLDRQDGGNRVETLLQNIPQKNWTDDPALIIIGPMTSLQFLRYLLQKLAINGGIVTYGRVQIFASVISKRYHILTALPGSSAYKNTTVLTNLFFDIALLETFDRHMFLPWRLNGKRQEIDPNTVFLVKLTLKKELPLATDQILPFIYFVTYFHNKRIIPALELFWSGCGKDLIMPSTDRKIRDINIWTTLSELEPNEILNIFQAVTELSSYNSSSFMALVENQMRRVEATSDNLDEIDTKDLHKSIADEMEIKFIND